MSVRLVYFAWLRERVGMGHEDVILPQEVRTVSDLVHWLRSRDESYDDAFRFPEMIRVAINEEIVEADTLVAGAREIAFFPPMTGG